MSDCEQRRWIDRIRAISFKEAKDEGAGFITRRWVAERIGRSEEFVKLNWNRDPYQSAMDTKNIGKSGEALNHHEKRIIRKSSGKQRKSCRNLSAQIASGRGDEGPSHMTVYRYRKSIDLKPFHVIKKTYKNSEQRENRLWFCDFLRHWDASDFVHVACSDEFFIWTCRRPNFQNDRIWATSVQEIEEREHIRDMVAHPECVGLFLCFTAKKLMWVIKEDGHSWNGEYFRSILSENVFPFLRDEENVVDPSQVTFLHDKAPCFKASATQQLLRSEGIDFFDATQWPGNSPDLNPCENIGAIIKDKVEAKLHRMTAGLPIRRQLDNALHAVLREMEYERDLFEKLLRSVPDRLAAVKAARGGHTDF